MILIDRYIEFLVENQLTQDQYLLLHLLKENRADLITRYKNAFPNEEGTMIGKELITDLIAKEFLIKTTNGFKLGDKIKNVFSTPDAAVDEIYDIYPAFIQSDKGVSIPLISMDKKVFRELYIPRIMGSQEEHKEVIKDLEFGISNDLIKMGINKFLTTEQWKVFRKLRTSKNPTITDMTADDFE